MEGEEEDKMEGDLGDRDSDGDSSSSESESELQQQVEQLQENIEASPYHYDSHVQLIQLLRQLGDLDKARQARRNMNKIFPLSEELWLQWIGDELPLCSIPEAALEMGQLFETAVKDYLSVPVWLQYAQFAVEHMSLMPGGVAFPREVFEKAIVSCGLHVAKAGLLWTTYLEFELAVMTSLQQMQQNDPNDDDMKKQVEEQYEKLEKVYKRKCAVPHIGLESVPEGLEAVLDVADQSSPAYLRAKKKLEEYLPFETQLEASTPPSLSDYYSYLSHLSSTKDNPSTINTLYQRAIAHHCLDTDLWKQYLKFLESNFKRAGSVVLPVYEQSVRNCPWVVDFWLGYARTMERNSADTEDVHGLFDRALEGNLSEGRDYLELWTAYCDYMRRRIDFEADTSEEVRGKMAELRTVFTRARSHLNKFYGNSADPTDSLSRYQIAMETQCHKHDNSEDSDQSDYYAEVKKLWKDVMTRHGREAKYWMEYAKMERDIEHYDDCRKVFQMAINSASDDPESVCEAMLQFEREHGSLETFEAAMEKCSAQLKRVRERREIAAEKEAQKKEEAKKLKKQEKAKQKKAAKTADSAEGAPWQQQHQQQQGGKRSKVKPKQSGHVFFESSSDEEGVEPVAKKPRVSDEQDEVPSAVPISTTEAQPSLQKKMPPPGYKPPPSVVKQATPSANQPSSTKDGITSASPGVAMETESSGEGPKVVGSRESRTVFVSNLAMNVTEERLKEKFSECGTISEVRLIKTRSSSKRANAYAYIEYTSPDPVESALALDRSDLDGRPLYVSRFREKGEKPQASQHSDNRSTLYVSNIQHHFGDHDLQELFQQCGPLKEVRLVKNRAGKSKGFAYIEYLNESSAKEAVLKLDNHQLGLKRIKVAISNPPKKSAAATNYPTEGGIPANKPGGGNSDGFKKPSFIPPQARRAASHASNEPDPFARRSKTNISLVPRTVARGKSESAPGNQQAPSGTGNGEPASVTRMSNDDFRKLLSKK